MTAVTPQNNDRFTFNDLNLAEDKGVKRHTNNFIIFIQNKLSNIFPCCFSKIVEFKTDKGVYQVNLKSFENFLRRCNVENQTIEKLSGNIEELLKVVKSKIHGPQNLQVNNNNSSSTSSSITTVSTSSQPQTTTITTVGTDAGNTTPLSTPIVSTPSTTTTTTTSSPLNTATPSAPLNTVTPSVPQPQKQETLTPETTPVSTKSSDQLHMEVLAQASMVSPTPKPIDPSIKFKTPYGAVDEDQLKTIQNKEAANKKALETQKNFVQPEGPRAILQDESQMLAEETLRGY